MTAGALYMVDVLRFIVILLAGATVGLAFAEARLYYQRWRDGEDMFAERLKYIITIRVGTALAAVFIALTVGSRIANPTLSWRLVLGFVVLAILVAGMIGILCAMMSASRTQWRNTVRARTVMFIATMLALVGVAYLQYTGNRTGEDTADRVTKIERETIPCLADERCREVLRSVVARNENKPISEVELPSLKEAEEEIQKESIRVPDRSTGETDGGEKQAGGRDKDGSNQTPSKEGGGKGGGGNQGGDNAGGGAPPSGGADDGGGGGSIPAPGGGDAGGSDPAPGEKQAEDSASVEVLPSTPGVCVEVPRVEAPPLLETNPLQVGC